VRTDVFSGTVRMFDPLEQICLLLAFRKSSCFSCILRLLTLVTLHYNFPNVCFILNVKITTKNI